MKNRLIFLMLTALGLLVGCAATEQSGPDESAKTRIAGNAVAWAEALNSRDFDTLPGFYARELDFNGRPMAKEEAVRRIEEFITRDYSFQVVLATDSWKLDSMRGTVYSGHFDGYAKYTGVPDSIPMVMTLWMSMLDGDNPRIVGQFDKIGAALETLKQRKKQIDLAGRPFDESYTPNFYFWQAMLDSAALTKPGRITHIGKYQGLFYTYVSTAAENGKYGIADINGKLLLAMEYDDIGTIGVLAPSTVEVKRGTLKGLARLDGSLALPVEYDALLPGFGKAGVTVWAQKGGSWQAFGSDLSPLQPEGGQAAQGPDWPTWLAALPFDSDWDCRTEFYKPAFLADVYQYDESNSHILQSYHLLRLPFAMTERHMFSDIYGGGFEFDGGTQYSVDSIFQQADGSMGMLTTIESWGIGGRESYHDQELRWVVFEDELADTAQSIQLYNRNIAEDAHCSIGSYTILGDSLIQATTSAYFLGYYAMPSYRYYRIRGSSLTPLYPEREFPFMSVLRIDADFLSGCFYGNASEEERAAFGKTLKAPLEEYQGVDRTADHFTAEDLDYLVNEVYAAHGKRFKGEKWQKYFGEKAWYKPVADDVEGQLSAIERANIAFVRNVQGKVRQSEASYTHAKFSIGEYY
jgi:YARHG domain